MSTLPIDPGWEVTARWLGTRFFSAVAYLVPPPFNFLFEGTSISDDVWKFLQSYAVPESCKIPTGTIWPKPCMIHVGANEQFLRELAALADKHAEPEICDHLHAYTEPRHLLQWYDAFCFDMPLLIDKSIPEKAVQQFCERIGGAYKHFAA